MDMSSVLMPVALVILAVITAWAEPRRLAPGLLMVPAIGLGAMWVLGFFLDQTMRWGQVSALLILGFLGLTILMIALLGLFLLVNAWTVMRRERPSLAAAASGAIGAFVVGYVALGVIAVATTRLELAVWLLFVGLPAGYLGYVFASYLLYSGFYVWWTRRSMKPVDAVIVLGAGLGGGERVTPLLASRLESGREVYEYSRRQGRSTVIVTSGGQGADEKLPEAEAMANYLIEAGVPEAHVMQENRSTDTQENLTFSKELLSTRAATGSEVVPAVSPVTGTVAVATNNYHTFRAAQLMRRLKLPGYAIGGRTARYYWPSATVREFIAILRDHAKLNIAILILLSLPLLAYAVMMIFA